MCFMCPNDTLIIIQIIISQHVECAGQRLLDCVVFDGFRGSGLCAVYRVAPVKTPADNQKSNV